MGGDLLRREVLSLRIALFLTAALCLSAGGNTLRAADDPEPRPLRRLWNTRADHPQMRNMLPPSYLAPEREESLLLTQAALERPLTVHYIRQYSSPGGLSWLAAVMKRGEPYLAFIRKEIAARNLPRELLYLPIIESGYLPQALSRAGAAGLWQFMKNSSAPFDMAVNDWIDERRDFWKSTLGALTKLEENYKYFGDWPLALAAYNAGLGGVSLTLRRSGIRDYWLLSEKKLLKTETAHYVPKLLAAAYILENPRKFGLEALWPEDPRWERVPVTRTVDLTLLSEASGVDRDALVAANRELLHGVTPPGGGYFLKARGKDAEKLRIALAREDIPMLNYYVHTIHSGDTLSALAAHYGIGVEQITSANPGIRARSLRIGSRLLIPALKDAGPYTRPVPAGEKLDFDGSHLVARGETLWSIALLYGVDPEVLAEANGMGLSDILREGKTLKTPIRKQR